MLVEAPVLVTVMVNAVPAESPRYCGPPVIEAVAAKSGAASAVEVVSASAMPSTGRLTAASTTGRRRVGTRMAPPSGGGSRRLERRMQCGTLAVSRHVVSRIRKTKVGGPEPSRGACPGHVTRRRWLRHAACNMKRVRSASGIDSRVMDPLTALTYDTFRPLVGQAFRDADSGVELELLSVDDLSKV